MAERKSKPEIATQKREIKFAPAIGDWTTYKPPKVLVKKVKTGLYGFDRLSKKELNLVLLIHYRFIQNLLKRFKIDLGTAVELLSIQADQTTYLNFFRTLTGQVLQGKIAVPGIHEPINIFFDLPIANSIVNYALGSHDLETINRGLTESENNVLSTAFSEYLTIFSAAFENTIKNISFSIVSSPDVVVDSSVNPSSTLVSFRAVTSLADNPPGKIVVAYSGNTLKTLLAKYREKEQSKPLDFSRLPVALLLKIISSVSATLGETFLTTNEIDQLEIGDVVSLESTIDSPIPLEIGNILKCFGQPGIKNKKYATRIVGFKEAVEIELPKPELEAFKKPEEEKAEVPEKAVEEKVPEEEVPKAEIPKAELEIKKPPEEKEEIPEEEEFPEEEEEEFPEEEEEEFPEEEEEEFPEEEEEFPEEEEEEFPEEEEEH